MTTRPLSHTSEDRSPFFEGNVIRFDANAAKPVSFASPFTIYQRFHQPQPQYYQFLSIKIFRRDFY